MQNLEVPMLEPVVDRTTLLFTQPLVDWLLRLVSRIPATQRLAMKSSYASAIPPTALVSQQRGVAFLRVLYLLRVTQPASGDGRAVLTFHWTDAEPELEQSAVLDGTPGRTSDRGSVLIHANRERPITYDVAYDSQGETPLHYVLDLVVEQVNG